MGPVLFLAQMDKQAKVQASKWEESLCFSTVPKGSIPAVKCLELTDMESLKGGMSSLKKGSHTLHSLSPQHGQNYALFGRVIFGHFDHSYLK